MQLGHSLCTYVRETKKVWLWVAPFIWFRPQSHLWVTQDIMYTSLMTVVGRPCRRREKILVHMYITLWLCAWLFDWGAWFGFSEWLSVVSMRDGHSDSSHATSSTSNAGPYILSYRSDQGQRTVAELPEIHATLSQSMFYDWIKLLCKDGVLSIVFDWRITS